MAHVATGYTVDELISVCIARQVADGDVLAQGIATPLVMAGYLLAKHTHAPHVSFASAAGNALVDKPCVRAVGVAVEKIRVKTGFPLEAAPDLREAEPPKVEEVQLLREVIDPLGIRRLETLSDGARKRALREILESEKQAASQGLTQPQVSIGR